MREADDDPLVQFKQALKFNRRERHIIIIFIHQCGNSETDSARILVPEV